MSDIREADTWLENNPICDADDLNKRERELVQAAWQAALSANGGEATPYGYLREVDGRVQLSVGPECPPNRSGGIATPWQAIFDHPAPPSVAVPEGWKLVPVEPTPEMREAFHDANEEWEDGGLNSPDHQYQAMLTAAPSPDHIADAGKVVPIGYLTNQAVARLQSDKRLNGEHLYAFKPDDLSKFQAVCLAPTVNESLTIEDFNGMCRIVEAVSQMTDGFAIDQCHMDRAREIVQDATRPRTDGDEGEGA